MSGLIIEESKTLSVASLCEKLATSGVEARPFWKPVHLQTPYQSALTFNATVSEELWSRIITLPCSTGLTDAEQQKTIDDLSAILQLTYQPEVAC
jgi:dTDP-4-amino-4,6-dideoxygalactose transaminase